GGVPRAAAPAPAGRGGRGPARGPPLPGPARGMPPPLPRAEAISRRYSVLDSAPILAQARERVRRQNGGAVGRSREELITPALVLDIDAAQRNIDRMASGLLDIGNATIRPHYKAHKAPDLAWRQVEAGAAGLSTATVWEAAVLADAGLDDLFVVNTVSHPAKIAVLARLAADHRILVAVDEAPNATALSAAATAAGS